MKKIIFLLAASITTLNLFAQKTNPADSSLLKTQEDSLSYVLGEVAAFNLKNNGFGEIEINPEVFMRAVTDVLGKKQPLIDDVTANNMLNQYMMNQQVKKSKVNIEAGAAFLAENAKRPGVKTTASGLQYEVIVQGSGIRPTAVDTFVAHYRGTLIDGTEFDASYNRGQPLEMEANRVIAGWTEGLQLMQVGSKYKFYIPYNLAYGIREQGAIPGGSTLIFEVELLGVKRKRQ